MKNMDVIELESGIKLPVIDALTYDYKTYILVGIISEDGEIDDDLYVYEKKDNEILEIEDNLLAEKLNEVFKKRLSAKEGV